ncbi:hypothetical protein GURASL_06260 [Geotalea uraniireducens]|uniref:Tetratricopeptide repeat protein n=1 Tax=Geotalea uraniireducens TaxID=351604 RepID=A0ABN6VND7_9BACT|nr:tetratricopeptide repeat protein [Geotalea uraniireducens]BDV41703.1 hypothetical protein GURASL_06260 [Geotalea uraniireducens]
MSVTLAAEWFAKGLESLRHDHIYLARTCFEHAAAVNRSPEICSYLALCQAKTRGKFGDAIALAREAIANEPANPVHYLNLGQIYLLAGMRQEAVDIFREGLRRQHNDAIVGELNRLGTRKPPVFRRLHRNHPLNKYMGIFLARLGLR